MTTDYAEDIERELPALVPGQRLAGMNRRRQANRLSESINGEYYLNRDGWVTYAEGHETLQGQRLINVKGWQRIPRSPRPDVNAEHAQRFHALLRQPDGPSHFPVAQIVTYGWHKRPPVVFVCRQDLDEYDHPEHTEDCFARVRFPQLANAAIYETTCALCKKYFASAESQAFVEVMAKKHMEVSHKDHLVNKELVTGLRDALAPALAGNGGGMTPDMVAQIAAAAAIAAVQQFMQRPVSTPNLEPVGEELDEGETETPRRRK